jgi:hypothetical protein
MSEVIIGRGIEGDIEITDLRDFRWILDDEFMESEICKVFTFERQDFYTEAQMHSWLATVNTLIELLEKYDVYEDVNVSWDGIYYLIAVPKTRIVIVDEDVYRVSLEHLMMLKEKATKHLEKVAKRQQEKTEYAAMFQDISERVDKLSKHVTGDTITLFLEKMIKKRESEEN